MLIISKYHTIDYYIYFCTFHTMKVYCLSKDLDTMFSASLYDRITAALISVKN